MRVPPKGYYARCFLRSQFGTDWTDYRPIRKVGVSPKGRWFAYVRTKNSSGVSKNNLFVLELWGK